MIRVLILAAAFLGVASGAMAQAVPRAADGHADLSGVWSNASVTHLTRPPGQTTLTVSKAAA